MMRPRNPSLYCATVVSDIVLRDLRIDPQKSLHAPGLGEKIRCMTELRSLDSNNSLQVKNVLATKQVDPTSTLRELAVKERIIIRTPADQGNVEVTGDAQARAYLFEFRLFHGFGLDALSDLIQRRGILAESMTGILGCL